MFERIKKIFARGIQAVQMTAEKNRLQTAPNRAERGTITRTCKKCGKTFSLPEEVQHWPDCCQECRKKYQIVEPVTRTCRSCGKEFTFPSNTRHWPNYCRECQSKHKQRKLK